MQTPAQVVVIPRMHGGGRLASVFLLNASIDATTPLELRLRGVGVKKARWLVPDGGKGRDLVLAGWESERLCRTPSMAAWSVACVDFNR
jgi:hypothetical protein